MPDITVSRLSAANEQEARIVVDKQIDYEFNNPVMESDFYEKPIMTSAYQQTKWFQISAESINGYLSSIGKDPYRLNVIYYYSGDYDDEIWSSANNTDQVVNYFGPNGLGYIPATPGETGSFVEYDNYELELLDKISHEPGYILQNRDHGWYSFWDCINIYKMAKIL